jgi:integrase
LEAEREKMGRLPAKMTVTELFVMFLEEVEAAKSEPTFLDYQRWCTEFAKSYGNKPARSITRTDAPDFKLAMLKKTYVRGKQPPKPYKPKTINNALIALRRAFNWAIDTGRLPTGTNPFAKVELLPCQGRERVATKEEYQALLDHCTDDAFRDVLVAMRHTSARPQEIYSLTWGMVDWNVKMWVLTKHKTSRTARNPKPRVIGMPDAVEEVRRWLREFGPTGHVFRNSEGRPWTKNALGLRMRRLRKRAGIKPDEQGEEFVLYTNRHTFLTAAGADPGISDATLMEVAGHTDPRTTQRYIHAARVAVAKAGRRAGDNLSVPTPASAG